MGSDRAGRAAREADRRGWQAGRGARRGVGQVSARSTPREGLLAEHMWTRLAARAPGERSGEGLEWSAKGEGCGWDGDNKPFRPHRIARIYFHLKIYFDSLKI